MSIEMSPVMRGALEEATRKLAGRLLDQYDDVPVRTHILTPANKQTRECLRKEYCALL
jgi:hypothetical protein